MSRDNYEEFPELTQQAQAAYRAGCLAGSFSVTPPTKIDRRYLSAFLLESMEQAMARVRVNGGTAWINLYAIAKSLHSPPPPLPTLAQAREADLESPAGRDLVRDFLASVREVDQ